MDYDAHLTTVEREARDLVKALQSMPTDRRVPTCPEWNARDLAIHVGLFTVFWSHVLSEGTGRPKAAYTELAAGADSAGWYAGLAEALLTELRQAVAGTPVWTWVEADQTAGFVARRCANELAVHRLDAQMATGSAQPLPADVAADIVDETFVMIAAWGNAHENSGRTLRVTPSDHPREWVITLGPDGPALGGDPASAELALSGTMSDVTLALYGRPPLGALTYEGDRTVVDGWYREFTFT